MMEEESVKGELVHGMGISVLGGKETKEHKDTQRKNKQ